MAWNINTTGSPGQVNAAVAALTVTDTGNGESAQLARAKSNMVNEVNAFSQYHNIHLVAYGQKDAQVSRMEIRVNVVNAQLGGQIMWPPDNVPPYPP